MGSLEEVSRSDTSSGTTHKPEHSAGDGVDESAVSKPQQYRQRRSFASRFLSGRAFLWASLVLVPITLLARAAGVGDVPAFVLAVAALIPLAWVIGEATEQVGEYTGPGIAGLLNASFGNAPELIISLLAVDAGLVNVVRGSLVGSVIGNLLLVLGCSLAAGGKGHVGRRSTFASLGMVALALVCFGVATGVSEETSGGASAGSVSVGSVSVGTVTVAVAAVLLCLYIVTTVRSVMREHREHRANGESGDPKWPLPAAVVALGLATAATVGVSEVLTGTIEAFADSAGLSDIFVALVIVAIAGNAAEHGGAVVIAARGGVRLASEIGVQSAAQVAVGLIPAVVLLSLVIRPLPLVFTPLEFAGMGVATVLPAVLLARGVSSRSRGIALCVAYAVIVAAFFFLAG